MRALFSRKADNENGAQNKGRIKKVIGWTAVVVTVIFTGIWTYWGILENFHEGWYSESVLVNLQMLFFQYLLIPICICVCAVLALKWPKIGLGAHIALGLFFAWFFRGAAFIVIGLMIVIPIIALGFMYFFGKPEPRKWAYRLVIIIPLAIILVITPIKSYQLSQRVNDGDFGTRLVEGNNVSLVWAPRGPGWPEKGVSYNEAVQICKYLSEDGKTVMEEEQNIWRLPTVDEAVRSMMLHNENAGGTWDAEAEKASYEKTPDKETPLWDIHSQIIYYWTQTEADSDQAYIVVYNGGVFKRDKDAAYGYLSFRAVKPSIKND
jgi:type IV secretory pathway VirB2 component (pilin)